MHFLHILQLLALLTLANGTPIVAKKIFGPRFARPLDGGIIFFDGRPLLGHSKTIRGITASILITTASAPLIGLDVTIGAGVSATDFDHRKILVAELLSVGLQFIDHFDDF